MESIITIHRQQSLSDLDTPVGHAGDFMRVRQFHIDMGMMMGMKFFINGKEFDLTRIDTPVKLRTIEEWEYVNGTPMDHPMHLHVNSFQAINPEGEPERAWRDVINVKANSTARFRVALRDFAGKTVQHPHPSHIPGMPSPPHRRPAFYLLVGRKRTNATTPTG